MESKLVTVVVKSPNHSDKRAHYVTRITPHCMVGQLSAKQCGDLFKRASYQASSNYGVGKYGDIGLYVDEDKRSWCSSSADNDNRAITIECASDTRSPYRVNAAVWQALVNLCIDICERYGKTKLIWFGDKQTSLSYKPKDNEMILTVHRWFAAKSCPGDYLYSRMGELAETVTKSLSKNDASVGLKEIERPNTAAQQLVDNEEDDRAIYIWNFFRKKGLNEYAVAGLMGNLYAESALRPNNLQNSFEKKLDMTDKGYTDAVNKHLYSRADFAYDGAGYGLAQWTFHTRKSALWDFTVGNGVNIDSLEGQCEFLWQELQGYKSVLDILKTAKGVRQASNAVLTGYEKPADQGDGVKTRRARFGEDFYHKYAYKPKSKKKELQGYYIQFGAFSNVKNAQKRLEEVKNAGFDVEIEKFEGLYRVVHGYFDTVDDTQSFVSRARSAGWSVIIKERMV